MKFNKAQKDFLNTVSVWACLIVALCVSLGMFESLIGLLACVPSILLTLHLEST